VKSPITTIDFRFVRHPRGLSGEVPVRAVEKGTVSENLRVSKTEAQQDQGEMERGCTFPIFDVPPLGQVWTSRQCRSLQGEKHNEKAEVTPE
jgi:hypothetical protein